MTRPPPEGEALVRPEARGVRDPGGDPCDAARGESEAAADVYVALAPAEPCGARELTGAACPGSSSACALIDSIQRKRSEALVSMLDAPVWGDTHAR